MSLKEPTTLQLLTDQALLDGVDPVMKRYLIDQEWDKDDIKKLAFTLKFWREAVRSKPTKQRESNIQKFLAALTVHKGRDIVMPNRLSIFEDGDTRKFLSNKTLVKDMGKNLFKSDEFKTFKYETEKHNVQLGDLSGINYGVKHVCPKGVVIKFEGKISYLIEKTYSKINMFFRDPSAEKSRMKKIRDLKIEWKKAEVSIWDKVSIGSVAMGVRYDEPTKVYTVSDRPVYVELILKGKEVEHAFKSAGGDGNMKITSKSNLEKYVPKERWQDFSEDIKAATDAFAQTNTKILNEASEETRQKSRDALEKLKSHFQGSKKEPEVDYEEPAEAETGAARRDSIVSVSSDEDTNMSDVRQQSDGEL